MKTSLLHAAFFTPMADGEWGLPLLLWGSPGVAKTSVIKQLGKQYGVHVERVAPGARGEGAFGVTPIPQTVNGRVVLEYPPPDWSTKLDGGGIIFVDEINTAAPALQPALLDLVQERTIGNFKFRNNVRVIGAANPVNQAAGGWDIAPPQANRMGHIEWKSPTAEEWASYMMGGQQHNEAKKISEEESRVLTKWDTTYAGSCGLAAAFLYRRSELIHKMPNDGDPTQSRAWASPRTWEYATRARASAKIHALSEELTAEFVSAFIGPHIEGEWDAFIRSVDLPSPDEVLTGKVHFTHDPHRLDRTLAVLNSCAAWVIGQKENRKNEAEKALWQLLDSVTEDAKDIVVPTVTALLGAKMASGDAARKLLAKLSSVVSASGVGAMGRYK